MYKESKRVMPTEERRGRSDKYRLREMKIGECREYQEFEKRGKIVKVTDKNRRFLQGALFASASWYGLKITSEYRDGVLTIWRKS
jgi:hypothetical protein